MVITIIGTMVSENQTNITIPSGIAKRLDRFLDTDIAKEMGLTSRPQTVIMTLRELLDQYAPIEQNQRKISEVSKIEFVGTIGNKLILEDSECGTISVIIDEDMKLQCFYDDVDPHDNKWVRYCLKNKETWKFLKNSGVKVVQPRTTDKDQQ